MVASALASGAGIAGAEEFKHHPESILEQEA